MNSKELEIINVTSTYKKEANKHIETSSSYGNKGEENNWSKSEKKEKACDGYVHMYECGKNFLHSTYERACMTKDLYIIRKEEIMAEYKY